jgi:hypothetical protein
MTKDEKCEARRKEQNKEGFGSFFKNLILDT